MTRDDQAAHVISFNAHRPNATQTQKERIKNHVWLLSVIDTMIDYCDEHDLDVSADRMRRVVGAITHEVMSKEMT